MKYRIITLIGLAESTLAVCFVYGNRLVYRGNPSSGSIWKKSEI